MSNDYFHTGAIVVQGWSGTITLSGRVTYDFVCSLECNLKIYPGQGMERMLDLGKSRRIGLFEPSRYTDRRQHDRWHISRAVDVISVSFFKFEWSCQPPEWQPFHRCWAILHYWVKKHPDGGYENASPPFQPKSTASHLPRTAPACNPGGRKWNSVHS